MVAPHPDDETLGCGALIAHCLHDGIAVRVLALTDGEASQPVHGRARDRLAAVRRREQQSALKRLGASASVVTRFGLPDGCLDGVSEGERARITDAGTQMCHSLAPCAIFVPAIDDDHPDHRWAARLGAEVSSRSGAHLFCYQIWPPATRNPILWRDAVPFHIEARSVIPRKQAALMSFRSQLEPGVDGAFRLPDELLARALLAAERFHLISDVETWRDNASSMLASYPSLDTAERPPFPS